MRYRLWQLRVWLRNEVQAACRPCTQYRDPSCHWHVPYRPCGESVYGIKWAAVILAWGSSPRLCCEVGNSTQASDMRSCVCFVPSPRQVRASCMSYSTCGCAPSRYDGHHSLNSVFTAEMYAAYRLFTRHQPRSYHLVCADSLSALQCLCLFSWLSHRCWNSDPSVPPSQLRKVCSVPLGTWTLWLAWLRGRRCGRQSIARSFLIRPLGCSVWCSLHLFVWS